MAVVTSTVTKPGGKPVHGATVTVALVSSGSLPGFDAVSTILGTAQVVTKSDGSWSVDLTPNASILPTNTHYRVTENAGTGARCSYAIIVPATAGPFKARDILATTPMVPDPLAPAVGGGVASVDGLTGVVALSDRYAAPTHNHGALYAPVDHSHAPSGGSGGFVPYVRRAYVKTGNVALNLGAAWATLPGFSLSVPAAVGDDVELSVSCMRETGSFLDLAVLVSGAAVRYASSGNNVPAPEGIPSLYPQPGTYRTHSAPFGFTVEAGDLVNESVTFGIMSKGTIGQLYASTDYPFYWRALNRGPVR